MRHLDERYPLYDTPQIASLRDMLRHSAATYGDKLALEDLNPTPIPQATFAELERLVYRFGKALRHECLQERDKIAVIAENRVQWTIAYLAAVCANLVVVPIDKSLKENEIVTILHASDARAVVFSESFRDTFVSLGHSVKGVKHLIDMDLPARDGRLLSMPELIAAEPDQVGEWPAVDPEAMAVIVFTSGAMGRAKGVMLSQANIAANLRGMLSMIELLPSDRFLSVLPIHHTYECTCGQLCPLTAGSSVHYARSLKTVVEDLQKVKATILLGVPLLYDKMYRRISAGIDEQKLLKVLIGPIRAGVTVGEALGLAGLRRKVFRKVHERFGGAIRIFIVGGAAPNAEVSAGLRALGFAFIQGYGLTETSPIVALNRLRRFRDDAAGLPLPNLEVRIDNPDAEGRGEVVVKGPSVMLGYYRDSDATAAVLKDGWFHTGDYGSIDKDGFLRISGRTKNVIVAATGKNVFPEELEDKLNARELIMESVVYGVRGEGGEEIGAIIVPNVEAFVRLAEKRGVELTREWVESVISEEIRALNRSLPLYTQIRHVKVREAEFEKTTTQKVKRYLVHQEDTTH
jgi:long-chain acyl-CoA synthetase